MRTMMHRWATSLTAILLSTSALAGQLPATAVAVRIEAQPLDAALNAWASQTGYSVLVPFEHVAQGKVAPGVQGTYTPEESLKRLLAKTGLKYQFVNEKTVRVAKAEEGSKKTGDGQENARAPNASETADPGNRSTPEDSDKQNKNEDISGNVRDANRSEEVVVTAQWREQRLQEVPMSISVVTGEQLDTSTATNLKDVLNRVPGVVATVPSRGNPWVLIRGVPPSAAGGTIGFYVDSVPFGFARFSNYPDMNAYDFGRIEVLRGPQGTLYGANSMNGVVRLLTKAPSLNAFEAKTRASVAALEDGGENHRVDAAVNIPLIEDRLAIRLVGGYQDLAGWIDKPNDADANSGDVRTLRAKLRAQPTEALTLDVAAWFSRSSFGAQSIGLADRTTPVTVDEPISTDFDTYSFAATYDFGGASITSATSYIDFAIDGSLSTLAVGQPGINHTALGAEVFSEELILQSTRKGPWRWSIGAMYRDAEDRNATESNGVPTADFGDRSRSSAVFGEATRELLRGQVEATLGLRYFRDKFSTAESFSPRGAPLLNAEGTSDALTPRAVLAWHPTGRSTVYASYAQGFRSGVTQNPNTLGHPLYAASGIGSVNPDTLNNYEIGAKGTLLDGRLSLEGALYYMDWQDVKATLSIPVGGLLGPWIPALVNGPGASGAGVDAMIAFRPVAGLEIGGSVSWNDLTMDDEVSSAGLLVYNKGDRLASSPEITAQGFAEYSFPLGSLAARISTTLSFISSQNAVVAGPLVWKSNDITTASARFSIDSGDRWSASLFVDNLSDENGLPYNNNGLDIWQPRIVPRAIGLQVEFRQ